MSDAQPPQYREFPRSTVELAGQSVSDVTHGIRAGNPLMMGVVVLNVIGIGCAVYFLSILINGQARHLENLMSGHTAQMQQIVTVHNREFDALMEMQRQTNSALAAVPSAPQPASVPTLPPAPARR